MQADKGGVPAIELVDVTRRFVSPTGKNLTALRDFDMSVAQGEFAAVVGPTGCGKSTTLNLVTGLARPTSGEVRLMGAPVSGIDPRVGFVFQKDALFPWKNVIDNVMAGPLFRGNRRPRLSAWRKTGSRVSAFRSSCITTRTSFRAACASASRWRRPS